jgi:hypothetical protein
LSIAIHHASLKRDPLFGVNRRSLDTFDSGSLESAGSRSDRKFRIAVIHVKDCYLVRRGSWAGRWHDNRHTLVTELAESGAGDQTIMDIAGHVSKQMLKHYSHIRMEAKRTALESIVKKPSSPNVPAQEQRQAEESLHGLQNGGSRPASSRRTTTEAANSARAKKNGTALLRIANDYAAF